MSSTSRNCHLEDEKMRVDYPSIQQVSMASAPLISEVMFR